MKFISWFLFLIEFSFILKIFVLNLKFFFFFVGIIKVNGEEVLINLFDCFSDEEYCVIREFVYRDSIVFILCYSVVDRFLLINIKDKWVLEIKKFFGKKIKVIVVGI